MPTSAPLSLARGLAGSFAIVIALAAMVGIGIPLAGGLGDGTFAARLIPAVIMAAVTLALIMLLLRLERRPWRFVGVVGTGKLLGGFGLGVATMAASAILMFGLFTVLGMIVWGRVDIATLGLFLLTNAVIALLLEAIPEEIVMRGYVQSSLGERFGRALTIALTTGFFLLAPFMLLLGQSVVASFISGVWTPALTPNGEHVAEYYILLAVFGVTLSLARGDAEPLDRHEHRRAPGLPHDRAHRRVERFGCHGRDHHAAGTRRDSCCPVGDRGRGRRVLVDGAARFYGLSDRERFPAAGVRLDGCSHPTPL